MDKVVDRVRKLLSLANNNANINEAAAAAAQAQKLIAQHQLNMATIAVENGKDSLSDEPVGISDVPLYEGKRAITWKGSLARTIAENNACYIFFSDGGNICVVGKPTNIEMTRFLYSYISSEIERLSETFLRRQGFGREGAKTWSNNFKLGAVSAVRDNLAAMKNEIQAQAASSAMVLIRNEDQAVKSFVENNMKLRQKPAVKITHDISARAAGYQAGKNIDVNRTGLGVGAETRKLG